MAEEWESESAAVTQLVEVVYGREAVFGAGDHHLSGKEDTGQKPASEDKGAGGVAGACQEQEEAMVSTEEDVGGDEGATEEEVADGDLERTLIESAELQGCSGTTSNSSMDLNCVRIEDNGKKGLFEVMAGEEVVTGTGRWQVAGNDGEKPPASLMDKGSEAEDAPLASKSPTRLIMNDHHLATGSPTKLTLAEAALPAPVALMLVADVEEVKYTQTSSVNTVVYESANPVLKSYETFHSASSAKLAAEDQPTPDSPLKERFLVDAPPSLLKQAAVSEVKYAPTRPITLLEEEEEAEMAPTSPAHLAFETEDCQISASQFNLGTGVEINVPAFSSHVMETHIPIERDAKTQYNNKLPNQSEKFSSLTSPKKPTPSETLKLQENLLNGAGGSEPEHNLANQKTQEADTLPQTLNSPSNRSTQEADTLPQTLSPSNRSILYNIPNMASPQNCADVEWPYALTNPPKRLSEDNLETMCKHKKLTVKEVPDYSASCQPETNWQLVSDHSQRTLPGEHPVSSGSCSKGMAEEYVAYASNPKKKPADEDTEFVGISQKRVAEVKVEPLASLRSTSEEEMEMLTNHMTAEDDQEAEVVPESVQNPLLEVKPQSSVQTRDVEEDLLATYPLKCATEEVLSVTSTHQSQRIDASLLVPPIPDSPQMQDGLKAPLVHEKQIASEFKSPSYLKPVIDDVRLVPSVSEEQETEIDPLAQFVPRKQMINDGLFIRSISEETMTQDSLLVPAVSEAQVTEDSTLVTSELETHELETHVMKFGQLVTSASEEHETKDDMFISHSFEVQVTEDDTSAPLVPKTSAAEAASSVMSSLKTKVTLVPSIPNEGLHTRSDHLTVSNPKVLKKPVVDQDNSDDLAEDCAQEYPGSPMELDDEDSQDACENPNMGENLQAQIISVCPAVPSQGSQSGSDGAGKQDPNLTAGVCNGGIAGTGVSANQTYLSHGAAAYLGSEGEDSSLPYSLEFEKHWKATQENPSDFTAWTNLLEYVGQENYILAARKAYTAFFTCYPYCYGYWKKYADMERRFGNLKEAEEVIEQSLQAIPLSVDLWMHFITFLQETLDMIQPESVQKLRNVFEMALAAAGMDFHSDNLWDMYINWEKAQGEMQAVTAIYDRVLATPTQLYSHHFEKFKEHVTNNSPVTIVSKEEFMWLKSKLMPEAELTVNGGNGDELHVHEASEEAAQVAEVEKRSDVDLEKMKELIISLREQLYKQNEAEVSKRWTFEETIKRPYFHVKPLERAQLINWNNYLDFEIANGSHSRTIVLFERCVIACAQYEEFWLKYTKYLENHTAIGTRSVFQRSCLYHLPKKPNLHLLWATFEEKQGDIEQSRNILKTLDDAVPGLAMVRLRRVSLERRAGNIEAAEALLHESILESEGTPLAAFYSIKLARQVLKIQKNLGKAREILQEALKKDPDNTKLYLNLLEVEFSADPKHNERNTINCIAKVLRSNLPGDAKIVFSQRRVEFLEDFGSSIHSCCRMNLCRPMDGPPLRDGWQEPWQCPKSGFVLSGTVWLLASPSDRRAPSSLLTAYDDHQKLLKLHAPKRKVSENGTTDEPEEKKSKVDETTSAQTVTAASSTPLIVGDASTNHITASAAYDYNTWYQNYGAYSYQNTWNYKYFPQS